MTPSPLFRPCVVSFLGLTAVVLSNSQGMVEEGRRMKAFWSDAIKLRQTIADDKPSQPPRPCRTCLRVPPAPGSPADRRS